MTEAPCRSRFPIFQADERIRIVLRGKFGAAKGGFLLAFGMFVVWSALLVRFQGYSLVCHFGLREKQFYSLPVVSCCLSLIISDVHFCLINSQGHSNRSSLTYLGNFFPTQDTSERLGSEPQERVRRLER